eukprot:scaffold16404_cov153-Amphora_coffeaeformis.AAC.2
MKRTEPVGIVHTVSRVTECTVLTTKQPIICIKKHWPISCLQKRFEAGDENKKSAPDFSTNVRSFFVSYPRDYPCDR